MYSGWLFDNVDKILMDHGCDEAQAIICVTKTVPRGTGEAEERDIDKADKAEPLPPPLLQPMGLPPPPPALYPPPSPQPRKTCRK